MKHKLVSAASGLLATGLVLLTGCETVHRYSLTYRLWDNEDWRKWSEPAPNPNLALYQTTNHGGVAVQYDAFSESHDKITRHAYYLLPNQVRVNAGSKPELVELSTTDQMQPIPVLQAQGVHTSPPPELRAYAILNQEGRGFTLYCPTIPGSAFDLPVYPETSGTTTRVLLTPFAVAGDTVMVGGVAAIAGALLWLQCGAPGPGGHGLQRY